MDVMHGCKETLVSAVRPCKIDIIYNMTLDI